MGLVQPPTSSSWKLLIYSTTHTLFCFFFEIGIVCTPGVVEIEHVWTQFISINILKTERNIKSNCASIHIRVFPKMAEFMTTGLEWYPESCPESYPRIIPWFWSHVFRHQANHTPHHTSETYHESYLRNIPRIIPSESYLPFNTLSDTRILRNSLHHTKDFF